MTRYPKKGKGTKWSVRELEAIPAEWKGDAIADGGSLVGEVRLNDGAVSVAFRYGFKWNNSKAWHYCGAWPTVDLAQIRATRDRAKEQVAQGIDPRAKKVADRIDAQRQVEETIAVARQAEAENKLVRDLYDAWIKSGVHRKDDNAELKRVMEKDVLPGIGEVPLRDLTDGHIVNVLQGMVERGANRLAAMAFQMVGQMLRWGEKRKPWRALLIEGNPIDLVEMETVLHEDYDPDNVRERVLPDGEIKELAGLFRAGQIAYDSAPNKRSAKQPVAAKTQLAVWICVSTICRIGELMLGEKDHVNLDEGTWFIPRENVKGRRRKKQDLLLFLSPFSINIFSVLLTLNPNSKWLFAGDDEEKPINAQTVTKQIGDRQAMFKEPPALKEGQPIKERRPLKGRRNDNTLVLAGGASGKWTPHDLRRTGATIMQSLGVDERVVDRCQNHVVHTGKNKIRRHYQLYEFAAEKRAAWLALGEHLTALLGDPNSWMPDMPATADGGKVVELRRTA